MNILHDSYLSGASTISVSNTTEAWDLSGQYASGYLLFGDVTALNFTLQVKHGQSGTFIDWPCEDAVAGTPYAAGGTITASDNKRINFDASGVWAVQITYVSGTGPVYCGASTAPFVPKGAPITIAGGIAKADSAAHTSGDVGVMGLYVRKDTQADLAGADGDYAPGQLNSVGDIRTTNAAVDTTNGVMKVAERNTAGTLLDGADGATLTGVGVLSKLIITNGSGSAITAQVYDNTSATGTKLTPTLCIPTVTTLQLDLDVPYALGVYVDFSTPTTCTAIGYSKAVV